MISPVLLRCLVAVARQAVYLRYCGFDAVAVRVVVFGGGAESERVVLDRGFLRDLQVVDRVS